MPKCEPFASVPLLRHSAAFCAECPRHCDEPAYHISSVICWRPLSDHVIQWCPIKSVFGGWIPYGIHGGRCLPPDKAICNNILWNLYKIWGELVLFWVISASGKTDGFVDIGHPPHHLRRYASIYLQNNACSSIKLLFSKVE